MSVNLKGKSFLTLIDYSKEEIRNLLDISHQVKKEKDSGLISQRFIGKTLAMIFEKTSTRTRCAFETAFGEEGGHPVFLSLNDIQLGEKESLEDTARVIGRMFDAIMFRGYKQETVVKLSEYAGIPVYNGLTDLYHPTQFLADIMTIEQEFNRSTKQKLVYIGDGRNNVAHSLLIGCSKIGIDITIITPEVLFPNNQIFNQCIEFSQISGSHVEVTADINKGIKDANAVYTDVWTSMGEEHKKKERIALLRPYQVNEKLMTKTGNESTIFLHCLPAEKGKEVTTDVIEGSRSRVWDEAENRKHTIKALMIATL